MIIKNMTLFCLTFCLDKSDLNPKKKEKNKQNYYFITKTKNFSAKETCLIHYLHVASSNLRYECRR